MPAGRLGIVNSPALLVTAAYGWSLISTYPRIQLWTEQEIGTGWASGTFIVKGSTVPGCTFLLAELPRLESIFVLCSFGSEFLTASFWLTRITETCGSKRQLWLSKGTSAFSLA